MPYKILITKNNRVIEKTAPSVIDLNKQLRTYRRKGILIEDVTANR